jgi:hypothetical protein
MKPTFAEMFQRLRLASGQTRSARTVEMFGWLILVEAVLIMFFPLTVMAVLGGGPLAPGEANMFRLVAVLVGGVGMLYVVSGRLNSLGFTFASLLDRPLVPPLMALLWWLDIVPGGLALAFSLQDFASFLWTFLAWRAEQG